MSEPMTASDIRTEATRLEQVAKKDVSALAAQLHAMNPQDRLAVSNQIRRDQQEHRSDALPHLDFYTDGDLKSAEKHLASGQVEQQVYDDDTGRIVRYALENDNPYDHARRARELFDPNDPKRQDGRSAEREWKKAIDAADNLPFEDYRARLDAIRYLRTLASDPLEAQDDIQFEEALKQVIDLPWELRLVTAQFYLENGKPDEAKAMLEEALEKNQALKDEGRFKQLCEAAGQNHRLRPGPSN